MELSDVVLVCKAYARMGGAIQEQLDAIADVGVKAAYEQGRLNPNALRYVRNFLEEVADVAECDEAEMLIDEICEFNDTHVLVQTATAPVEEA